MELEIFEKSRSPVGSGETKRPPGSSSMPLPSPTPNRPQTTKAAPSLAVTKTRCPHCSKLFSIETDVLVSLERAGVSRAEFQCTAPTCAKPFFITLPFDSSLLVAAAPILETKPESAVLPEQNGNANLENSARFEITKPSKAPGMRSMYQAAKALGMERECPRCGAENPLASLDCVRCGVIFDKYFDRTTDKNLIRSVGTTVGSAGSYLDEDLRLQDELALGGSRELASLWDLVLSDYEDRIRHERFLNACRDAKALSYASKKYGQILIATPQDEIARLMRNKIVALISLQAERSRLPIQMGFKVPKMNTMVLFLGAFLLVAGALLPQVNSLKEIGISAILLSIGVQWALREKSH